MRIKLAPLVSEVRGRQGGIVATKGRGSETIRRFTQPANTQSAIRTNARNNFANLQNMYSTLRGAPERHIREYADTLNRTPRSWWLGRNLGALKGESDISALNPLPQLRPDIFCAFASLTGLSKSIRYNGPTFTYPGGWAAPYYLFWAFLNLDPRIKHRPEEWDSCYGAKSHPTASWTLPVTYGNAQYLAIMHAEANDPTGLEHWTATVTGLITTAA